jgi:hypothetical protein
VNAEREAVDGRVPGVREPDRAFLPSGDEPPPMPQIHLDESTVERLDALRRDGEEYDEIVTELINIYEAEELALFRGSDVE